MFLPVEGTVLMSRLGQDYECSSMDCQRNAGLYACGLFVLCFIGLGTAAGAPDGPFVIEFDSVGEYSELEVSSRSVRLSGRVAGAVEPRRMRWQVAPSGLGGAVEMQRDGRWSTDPIALAPGRNEITITVWDGKGHSEQKGLEVFRTSTDPLPDRSGVVDIGGRTAVPYLVHGNVAVLDGCIEISPALLPDPKKGIIPGAIVNPG